LLCQLQASQSALPCVRSSSGQLTEQPPNGVQFRSSRLDFNGTVSGNTITARYTASNPSGCPTPVHGDVTLTRQPTSPSLLGVEVYDTPDLLLIVQWLGSSAAPPTDAPAVDR
jgi:hypothetical protein